MSDFYKYHFTVFTYVVFHIMYSSFILLNFSFANFYKYYNTVLTYVVTQLMYSFFTSLDFSSTNFIITVLLYSLTPYFG